MEEKKQVEPFCRIVIDSPRLFGGIQYRLVCGVCHLGIAGCARRPHKRPLFQKSRPGKSLFSATLLIAVVVLSA